MPGTVCFCSLWFPIDCSRMAWLGQQSVKFESMGPRAGPEETASFCVYVCVPLLCLSLLNCEEERQSCSVLLCKAGSRTKPVYLPRKGFSNEGHCVCTVQETNFAVFHTLVKKEHKEQALVDRPRFL